ncbi:site-specific integrase [Mesorhizobium sp. AR07]|uniref:tyrosine-type recombinase/integrase n=1 Tax=Mesorhizobium sp. AR07 TaxID=2865838 RepID=UPI00215DEDD1|nr:site-specific integrase [Mesorhizobium sp. AR07]UVK45681.1 site-specific integrase [Mesorhizobium sp. AR07]
MSSYLLGSKPRATPLTVPPAAQPAILPLGEVWSIYFQRHIVTKLISSDTAKQAWKQLEPFFGTLPASNLTQATVDDYADKRMSGLLGRKVGSPTVLKELAYIRAALKFCADREFVPSTFVRKLTLPEPGEPRQRWLREDEIKRLKDAAYEMRIRQGGPTADRLSRMERFIALALETAGRQQALLDLTWDRVDFEIRVIELDVPGRKKTKKRRATVPISDVLLPVLERAYAERINDLVLDNKGKCWALLQHVAIEAGFADDSKRARFGQKPKATGISPHVFRHTAATMMARRGVPLWKISKILGNSLAMVERVYAKYQPDDLRDAVNLISNRPK